MQSEAESEVKGGAKRGIELLLEASTMMPPSKKLRDSAPEEAPPQMVHGVPVQEYREKFKSVYTMIHTPYWNCCRKVHAQMKAYVFALHSAAILEVLYRATRFIALCHKMRLPLAEMEKMAASTHADLARTDRLLDHISQSKRMKLKCVIRKVPTRDPRSAFLVRLTRIHMFARLPKKSVDANSLAEVKAVFAKVSSSIFKFYLKLMAASKLDRWPAAALHMALLLLITDLASLGHYSETGRLDISAAVSEAEHMEKRLGMLYATLYKQFPTLKSG